MGISPGSLTECESKQDLNLVRRTLNRHVGRALILIVDVTNFRTDNEGLMHPFHAAADDWSGGLIGPL